ncbi:hypothetical protein WA158_000501 [Blastocystis sp. Blastoise]
MVCLYSFIMILLCYRYTSHFSLTFILSGAAAAATKKKWSKGKSGDAVNNKVIYDNELFDKLKTDVPKMKLITVYTVIDRLKVNGSAARHGIAELVRLGLIKRINKSGEAVYTRA